MKRLFLITFVVLVQLIFTVLASEVPRFIEETTSASVAHRYDGGWEFFVGGGVAVFDCNGDSLPELYFAGGENAAGFYLNAGDVAGPLYFIKAASGLELKQVTGAYPLDIDADGLSDLVLLRVGENVIFRGQGNCRFERANEAWNFDGSDDWTTAFAASWFSGQSWPTLAFGNYIDRKKPGAPFGTCAANLLYRPSISKEGFAAPQPLTPSYCTLSLLFSDWNRSGEPALRVSNDRQYYLTNRDRSGQEQLWSFSAGVPRLYSEAEGWQKLQIWGMGLASADLTDDGYPEYFLTSMADNKLRTLASDARQPRYKDIAFQFGVTATRPFIGDQRYPSTAWHAEFDDVDNDGILDLFISKGNVDAMPDFALSDPNNLLLGKPEGGFYESADVAGVASTLRGRGGAVVDLNLDGMLDIVVVNRADNVQLWRNVGLGDATEPLAIGNWLELRLQQAGGNRDAIGAWLEIRTGSQSFEREITVGGGHASGALGWLHLGLGNATSALVRVRWPDGGLGPWLRLEANQFAVIERGSLNVRTFLPKIEAAK